MPVTCLAGPAAGQSLDEDLIAAIDTEQPDEALVRRLLSEGADPQAISEKGFHALAIAAIRGHIGIIDALLDSGADVDRPCVDGNALLHGAGQGHVEVAEVLILAGADVNAQSKGRTALYLAAVKDDAAMAALLLDAGAAVDARTETGRTPLMKAAGEGSASVATLLLRAGADPLARDAKGMTAADVARAAGHRQLAGEIEQHLAAARQPPDDAMQLEPGAELTQATLRARDGQAIVLAAGEYQGPVVVKGIRLAIYGDPEGGTMIRGRDEPNTAVVQVVDGGRLRLVDAALRATAADQLGVYVKGAHAILERCVFESPPQYACYAQEQGRLTIESCRFTRFEQAAVAAFVESEVVVRDSIFEEGASTALHIQDGGRLVARGCQFTNVGQQAVLALKGPAVEIRDCSVTQCARAGFGAQECASILVEGNTITSCQRGVAAISTTDRSAILGNVISDVPADGDGIYVEGGGAVIIDGNQILGGRAGIQVFGPVERGMLVARNTVLNVAEGGVYVETQGQANRTGVRVVENDILNCREFGIVVDGGLRGGLSRNTILNRQAIACSLQRGSTAILDGNVLLSSDAALNFFETSGAESSLRHEMLLGAVKLAGGAPRRLEGTRRLDAVRSLTKHGPRILGVASDVLARCDELPDDAPGALASVAEALATLDETVAAARKAMTRLASARLGFRDSTGRTLHAAFQVYDGTSPTVGSVSLWAGDLKDPAGVLRELQSGTSGLAQHLLATCDEAVRDVILAANPSQPLGRDLVRTMAVELNRLVDGELLYDEERCAGITLDADTADLLEVVSRFTAKDLESQDNRELRRRFNRQLIEHVLPYQIARTRRLVDVSVSEGWAYVPAGSYWLVSQTDPSLREMVALAEGQVHDGAAEVAGSLWVQFRPRADEPPRWQLFISRDQAQRQQAASWLRRPGDGWYAFSLRRPGVDAAALAEALLLARAALPEAARTEYEDYDRHEAVLENVMRILPVAGEVSDAQRIVDAVGRPSGRLYLKNAWARVIANLEARLGRLDRGTLIALLEDEDPDWALAAAMQLHRLGLTVGDDVLRAALRDVTSTFRVDLPAAMLLDSPDPETLQAMRAALDRMLPHEGAEWDPKHNQASVPLVVYLLAYGGLEEWALVSRVPLGVEHVSYLAFLSDDPMSIARLLIPVTSGWNRSHLLWIGQGFLDRDPREADVLYARLLRAIASHRAAQVVRDDPRQGNPFSNSMNTSNIFCSYFMPNRTAVAFYGGFGNIRSFEPAMDPQIGLPNLLGDTTWFAQPQYLDRYIDWWLEGNRAFEAQLDFVTEDDIARAVAERGGERNPVGYDLFMAAHRISTRASCHAFDSYPVGLDRRPYVLAHHGDTSGGISGVAEMRWDWDGPTLRIGLRLRQEALYHAGSFIDRTAEEGYEHHRYVVDGGRALIDNLTLRRDDETMIAEDTGRIEDGFFIFETRMDVADPAGWYLDVNMRFFDQDVTMIYPLFLGESARRYRHDLARGS